MHMSVYNNHFPKGYVCVCLLRPKSDRQRKVACNCSSNFKMLMSSAVPKKCLNSLWEQRISTFYLVEWYVKFQVKRNRSQYISSEISGYIEYNGAKQKRQCLASGMKEVYGIFLGRLIGCWYLLNWLTVTFFLGKLNFTEVSNGGA